jgi:glycosyltransferase involved in cell wall biosynthesis
VSIKISIITINYNHKDGILKTIESVANQTYQNIEYIVVDGGSNDGSVDVIKKYENKITNWVSEKDNGIYNAMNNGWQKATGEFCLFLNSGDYLCNNDVIKNAAEAIGKNEADIFFGDLMVNDPRKGTYTIEFREYPTLYYMYRTFFPHQASFIKRNVLEELNAFQEEYKIIADRVFFIKSILASKKFYLLKFSISYFELGGVSNSGLNIHQDERKRLIENDFPFISLENKNFENLKYYEMSTPHQLLEKALRFFGKGNKKKVFVAPKYY